MGVQADASLVALVISLIALVVAVGQALQQYVSTAEGFRRCRKDVIGNWSSLTKAPFDWRNLRFETRFVSPNISLVEPHRFFMNDPLELWEPGTEVPFDGILPVGSRHLPAHASSASSLPSARVSWLAFLDHICSYQLGLYNKAFEHTFIPAPDDSTAEKGEQRAENLDIWFQSLCGGPRTGLTMPVATRRVISWDFMPPDVVKPFATISLHDLLVLGHRLGLEWTEVNPLGGRLTAHDNYGNTISGTTVQGLGLMVQFQHDEGRSELERIDYQGLPSDWQFKLAHLSVPNKHADKLAFGVVPGDRLQGFRDVKIATDEDCLAFASELDEYMGNRRRDAREHLERSLQTTDITKSGIDQLMPLISPCLVVSGCCTTRAKRPHERSHVGVLEVMEGMVVFRERIFNGMKEDVHCSAERRQTIEWIQLRWFGLRDSFGPFVWAAMRNHPDQAKLSTQINKIHRECSEKLVHFDFAFHNKLRDHLKGPKDIHEYVGIRSPMGEMMRLHMYRAFQLRERAEQLNRKEINTYDINFPDAPMFCGMMHLMIDDLPQLARDIISSCIGAEQTEALEKKDSTLPNATFPDAVVDEVCNAWLIWIFRAFVFNRSANFFDVGTNARRLIPAQWLNSQLPVHIG